MWKRRRPFHDAVCGVAEQLPAEVQRCRVQQIAALSQPDHSVQINGFKGSNATLIKIHTDIHVDNQFVGMSQNHCTNRSTNLAMLECMCNMYILKPCILCLSSARKKMQRSIYVTIEMLDSDLTKSTLGATVSGAFLQRCTPTWMLYFMGNPSQNSMRTMATLPVLQHLAAKTSHSRLTPWCGTSARQISLCFPRFRSPWVVCHMKINIENERQEQTK